MAGFPPYLGRTPWTPMIIAAIRGTERIGLVLLLTTLTGVTWFVALGAAFILPRFRRCRARPAGRGP